MNDPIYKVGDEVEAEWNSFSTQSYKPATIQDVKHVYIIKFNDSASTYQRDEYQIRPARPSVEEAWEKAAMLIGQRAYTKTGAWNEEEFDKQTRHHVYTILGSAGIKITEEVKTDVRRLIGIADDL